MPLRSMHPAVAIRALLLFEIHLELALRPRQLPCLVAVAHGSYDLQLADSRHLQERIPKQHPAQVRDVAHAAVEVAQAKELDRAQNHHKVLELNRENIKNNDP